MSERIYGGWHYLASQLEEKYRSEKWFTEITNYLHSRYWAIKERFLNSFRYVDVHPLNASTFSYEYASLLRDVGSVYSSVMDSLVRKGNLANKEMYNILNYRHFLSEEIENLENICAELRANYNRRFLELFRGYNDPSTRISWWDAYNAVKHSDIASLNLGCQCHVLYGFTTISTIYQLISKEGRDEQLFSLGFHRDWSVDRTTFLKEYVFPINPERELS